MLRRSSWYQMLLHSSTQLNRSFVVQHWTGVTSPHLLCWVQCIWVLLSDAWRTPSKWEIIFKEGEIHAIETFTAILLKLVKAVAYELPEGIGSFFPCKFYFPILALDILRLRLVASRRKFYQFSTMHQSGKNDVDYRLSNKTGKDLHETRTKNKTMYLKKNRKGGARITPRCSLMNG